MHPPSPHSFKDLGGSEGVAEDVGEGTTPAAKPLMALPSPSEKRRRARTPHRLPKTSTCDPYFLYPSEATFVFYAGGAPVSPTMASP
ncbi:hypothetical protein BHE74_00025173 [Ensete ventricosum]|uniref:Uncharacterized protein n=1 Tax=Ensete ventricosum TaxID=4639 RepID=A0A445MGY4_ENSVE|nr:hypothetical protein BHE74_00025173 [Ensete ventricosum]RZR73473.1 hypothetical protein BHM03_00024785 [Ensete ventricosum]